MERPTTATNQHVIHVLATTFEGTRAALTAAVPLAKGAHARLVVLVTKIMPYALALDEQIDSTEIFMRRYRDLVSDLDGEARFRLCICRRPDDVVTRMLPRAATVVVGGPAGGLLPSQEVKLVRRMTKLGHHVVFVPMPQVDVMGRLRSALSLTSLLLAAAFALACPRHATAQTLSDNGRAQTILRFERRYDESHGSGGGNPTSPVPIDFATASASGLDPHISPAAALFQVPRVACARRVSQAGVRSLVESRIEPPQLGFLDESRVDVLLLNLGRRAVFTNAR